MQGCVKPFPVDLRFSCCDSNLDEAKALSQTGKPGKNDCWLRTPTRQRKPTAKRAQRGSVHLALFLEFGARYSFVISLIGPEAEIGQVVQDIDEEKSILTVGVKFGFIDDETVGQRGLRIVKPFVEHPEIRTFSGGSASIDHCTMAAQERKTNRR
jgi:hypothetical protein